MASATRYLLVALLALMGMAAEPVAASAQTPASGAAGGENVRAMTYNIKHAQGNDDCNNPTPVPDTIPEPDCELNLDRVASVIEDSGAAIVGLQEVDRFWARSGGVDQPAELAAMLDMNMCYGANLDHPADNHADVPHQYGTAVLSVHPIVECENTPLPTPEGWEQRGALAATIELPNGRRILVIDTHLQAGREGEEAEAVRQRTEQMQGVLDVASQSDLPVMIMGDLNATPGSDELAAAEDDASGFLDAWAEANPDGDGFTSSANPDQEPQARIDYVLVDDGFTVDAAEVIVTDRTRIAADHYPVVVDLAVQAEPPPLATPVS